MTATVMPEMAMPSKPNSANTGTTKSPLPAPASSHKAKYFASCNKKAATRLAVSSAPTDGTTRRSGIPITELRVAGGGSQSDQAMQITADVFGLPASRPHLYEASGLGAAIDAAVGLKLHPDFDAAIKEMTRLGDTFEPNPKVHTIYEEIYRNVYGKLYGRLKPLYEALRKVNGG